MLLCGDAGQTSKYIGFHWFVQKREKAAKTHLTTHNCMILRKQKLQQNYYHLDRLKS